MTVVGLRRVGRRTENFELSRIERYRKNDEIRISQSTRVWLEKHSGDSYGSEEGQGFRMEISRETPLTYIYKYIGAYACVLMVGLRLLNIEFQAVVVLVIF